MNTSFKLSQIECIKRNIAKYQGEINRLADEQAFSDEVMADWYDSQFVQNLTPLEDHFHYWMNWRDEYLEITKECLDDAKNQLEELVK